MIGQGWSSALESLAAHKLRSALTLLGIVAGAAAVPPTTVSGQPPHPAAARGFAPLGATLVTLPPRPPPTPPTLGGGPVLKTAGPGQFPTIPPPLDERDLQALK